jgi:hypothetical protein
MRPPIDQQEHPRKPPCEKAPAPERHRRRSRARALARDHHHLTSLSSLLPGNYFEPQIMYSRVVSCLPAAVRRQRPWTPIEGSEQAEKWHTVVRAFVLPSTEVRIIGHGLLRRAPPPSSLPPSLPRTHLPPSCAVIKGTTRIGYCVLIQNKKKHNRVLFIKLHDVKR